MLDLQKTHPRVAGSISRFPLLVKADAGSRLLSSNTFNRIVQNWNCGWVSECDKKKAAYASSLIQVASMHIWGDSYIEAMSGQLSWGQDQTVAAYWGEIRPDQLLASQTGGTLREFRDRLNISFSEIGYKIYALESSGSLMFRGQGQYEHNGIVIQVDSLPPMVVAFRLAYQIGQETDPDLKDEVSELLERARTLLRNCGVDIDEDQETVSITTGNDPGRIRDLPGAGVSGPTDPFDYGIEEPQRIHDSNHDNNHN